MSQSRLERWGIQRVAAMTVVVAELVVLAVVVSTFADSHVVLGAGVVWVLVTAPILYVALVKGWRETV